MTRRRAKVGSTGDLLVVLLSPQMKVWHSAGGSKGKRFLNAGSTGGQPGLEDMEYGALDVDDEVDIL